MLATLLLTLASASMTCPQGQAATGFYPNGSPICEWMPADTDADNQTCGMDGHRHSLILLDGKPKVEKEKHEPDIVFDGKCHGEDEKVIPENEDRKVLPVPKKESTL
jgi:hypothetical protein